MEATETKNPVIKTKWIELAIVILLLLLIFVGGCSSYNGMVTKEESVNTSWSQVENVYQRRNDLIGNLVETVQGYAGHENQTLVAVIKARSEATQVTIDASNMNAQDLERFDQVQGSLSSTLSRLMMIQEQYPNLKADKQFSDLMVQLEGSENRISTERQKFNKEAQSYNTYIRKFPRNIFAFMFGFKSRLYFKAEEGADKAPKVKFKS